MEKKWSREEASMEFAVRRWMSVDEDDGDVVREVAAHADKSPGMKRPRRSVHLSSPFPA